MLVQFKIKNFLSIKDEQVFSMVADEAIREKDMDDKGAVLEINDNLSLLKSAVIYGANASGKTNLIKGFGIFQGFIENSGSYVESQDFPFCTPFLLNAKARESPCLFEAVFIIDHVQYRYGFEIERKGIVEEWLYIKRQRETEIFYRNKSGINVNPKYKILNEIVNKGMLHNKSLLVSKGSVFNDETSNTILHWAKNLFAISGLSNHYSAISAGLLGDPDKKIQILELMKLADFGISDIEVEERDGTNFDVNFDPKASGNLLPEVKQQKTKVKILHSVRNVKNDKGEIVSTARMPFMLNESEGTIQFFGLIGPILIALKEGFVMVIDEMDVKLHPLLSQRLIGLFNSKDTNPKGAQLIFATHDTNLLDAHLFRRDQIWFTEKDKNGATTIYPLTDYKPRNDTNLEKNYIAGKYGGIPYLGDFDLLVKELFVSKKAKKKK